MDLALQAALLGAVMGSAVLAVSTIYGWTLPAAPHAYGWWAAGFVLEAVSKGVLLGGGDPWVVQSSDIFHGLAAGMVFCGALTLAGRRVTPAIMIAGLAASLGWAFVAFELRLHLGLAELPLYGIGGLPVLYAAWVLSGRGRRREGAPIGRGPLDRGPLDRGGHRLAALAFAADGLHQLAAPLLHVHTGTASVSFVAGQALSMAMAVGLLLVVVRRQQALAESEGERANLLQARLVDALGGVQDGIALYDANDRLVTSNGRYREFLSPAADIIRPGKSFEDILKAEANRGVVVEAKGREADWVFDTLADHATDQPMRETQLWDGRWVAVSVYRTADGGHLRILRDVTNRKQAELALEESVSWLRGIMDTVIDGILTIDETGTVLSLNPAAARIFGHGVDEVVGRPVTMLMPDAADLFLGSQRDGGTGLQINGRRKNGEVFPLELSLSEMRQGDLVTVIGVVRDITDRKRVEDALVESEQRFRDLAESASDWFWEIDKDFRFIFVSGRVRQVLGVGPGHFLGSTFAELAEAAESPMAWEEQSEIMRLRNPFRGFVFVHTTPAGAVKFIEMAGRPAFDAAAVFHGYRGTATDITPIKRHEQDLAAQAALRQAIIDNMAQGVLVFDSRGVLMALNSHARHMLDLSEDDARPGILVDGGALGDLARMGSDAVLEHNGPNGMVLEVRSNAMPGGGLILTLTDITDRKRFEDTLREAKEAAERGNRAKATFLANISHELRTPLNAIIGFSELMKHEIFGPLEPESYRNYVGDIHQSGMHLLELINDILDMSKAEAGMTDLVESVVDVSSILRSSVRMMMRRAESNRIALVEDLPGDLPFLKADEKRVRQIVLNLLSNAVKFTEEGGSVTVSASVSAQGFVIRVTDTGIGMSPDDLERVMEPFVQADTRLSRKYEGTGLGLPLTRALVQAHGGTLILESEPERGTTAIANFPAARIIDSVAGAINAQASLE